MYSYVMTHINRILFVLVCIVCSGMYQSVLVSSVYVSIRMYYRQYRLVLACICMYRVYLHVSVCIFSMSQYTYVSLVLVTMCMYLYVQCVFAYICMYLQYVSVSVCIIDIVYYVFPRCFASPSATLPWCPRNSEVIQSSLSSLSQLAALLVLTTICIGTYQPVLHVYMYVYICISVYRMYSYVFILTKSLSTCISVYRMYSYVFILAKSLSTKYVLVCIDLYWFV